MFRASGADGELWWIGDEVSLSVPLRTRDGWEWFPVETALSWWVSVQAVRDWDGIVEADTNVPAARVTTKRCRRGITLTADVVCRPLTLALTAREWELDMAIKSEPILGGNMHTQRGTPQAVLRGLSADPHPDLLRGSEAVLGRLCSGYMAYQGVCRVSDTGNSELSLRFEEGVVYDSI